jgi:peptide/nickel transport system substrate-binding protein
MQQRFSSIRRARSRSIFAFAIIFMLMLAPISGLAKQSSPEAGGGGTLVGAFDVGPGGCPECFNPLQATAGFTWLELYYSKLMVYDINFTAIEGDLAESWETSADGLALTLHLRDGVTWHDGEPFTSEDVAFTIGLVQNPDSASVYAAKYAGITSVDTPDPLTAVLNMSAPNAAILDGLTFLTMLPSHLLKDMAPADLATSDWWRTNPVGTGPFKWSAYEPGQYVELVANDDYWRGRPKLDKIINRYFPEAGTAVIALRSGEINFSYLTADEALSLQDDTTIQQLSGPSQVPNYLGFNMEDPRFQDERIRQAFMYAIDRNTILDQLFSGTAESIDCMFTLPQYVPEGLNKYDYNVDTAKQMLSDAGWDGSSVEIITYYADQLSTDILTAIQQFLADAGVTATIRSVDVPTFNQLLKDKQFAIFYGGAANGPDPDVMSATMMTGGSNNRTFIADSDLDALFEQGRAEADPDARAQIYQQACTLMNEKQYFGQLWISTRFGGSNGLGTFAWTPAPGGGRYNQAAETWTLAS